MSTNQNLAQSPQKTSIANFLNFPSTQKFLEDSLKDKKNEFVANMISLCDADANLAECDPGKLMKCAMNAVALGLPLNKNLGYAYVIPYKGTPSFQIGYKGFIQLALRSGQYRFLNACEVREGEITRNKITGEIKFNGENENGKVVGYIAYLELNNGFTSSLYMSEAQIEAHALRFSKMYAADKQYSKRSSKWSDADSRPKMAIKTVLKGLLSTYGVLSVELQQAFDRDNVEESDYEDVSHKSNRNTVEEAIILQPEPSDESNFENEKVSI